MTSYSTKSARPCGKGKQMPLGSITDAELIGTLSGYKRRVAGCYYSRTPDEMPDCFPPGPLHVSPKIDGALWFLVFGDGEPYLASPRGRVLVGKIPVIEEAAEAASNAAGRTIIAGELFAAAKKTRPRVGDLAKALGGEADAEVEKLAFAAFDLVAGGDDRAQAPIAAYPDRLEVLQRILPDGKRVKVVRTEKVSGGDKVPGFYAEWVEGGKGEGLVARAADGRIFKIKPQINIDAAVIGYTERTDDPEQVRSLLLALMRRDGHFHLAGSCGAVGSDDVRKELMTALSPLQTSSRFRHASSSGALFRFVKPEMVVEVRVTDIQNEDSSGAPISRMVLNHDAAEGWTPLRKMPGASLLHPVLVRIRDDKGVNPTDIRMEQVLERVLVSEVEAAAEAIELPPSKLLRREVYTKTTKGVTAVRKLVVWKTNKEDKDPDYPAYVVYWTDYSSSRKEPLKKEAKLAPTENAAVAIAEQMLKENIKKGWEKA